MDTEVPFIGVTGRTFATSKQAYAQGRPGSCESSIQRQKRVGFAIVRQHVGRVSISAQMHLKIKYGHGECFLEMENECWWHVYTSQMDPVQNHFFVKKQYPPFANSFFFFLSTYKMVAQKVNIPIIHTPPVPGSCNCLPSCL